jgi:hypothetical protein
VAGVAAETGLAFGPPVRATVNGDPAADGEVPLAAGDRIVFAVGAS